MVSNRQELVLDANSISCGRAGLLKLDLASYRVLLVVW